MSFHFSLVRVVVWILLSGLTIAGSVWYYRHTLPEVRTRWQWILSALRAIALLLLLSLIFKPVLTFNWRHIRKPVFGLLIDGTESMDIRENGRTRMDQVRQLLRHEAWRGFTDRVERVSFVYHHPELQPLPLTVDSIRVRGRRTNLDQMISDFADRMQRMHPAGLLLISDGAHNFGENPKSSAEALTYPVHTLTIGDTIRKPDIRLAQITTNSICYAGETVPVQLIVRSYGFKNKTVQLTLTADGKVQDRVPVRLPEDGYAVEKTLHFTPQTAGSVTLSGSVSIYPDEFSEANNDLEQTIRVLKRKRRVLLYARAPSPDYVFIKRILSADPRVELITRTGKKGSLVYEKDATISVFQKAEAFFILDGPESTDPAILAALDQSLLKDKKPLFLMASKHISELFIQRYASRIPAVFKRQHSRQMQARITAKGQAHAFFIHRSPAVWDQLAPVYYPFTDIELKTGASVLQEAVRMNRSNQLSGQPLFISRQLGAQKDLVFLGSGVYRWTFSDQTFNETLFPELLENIVRWLVISEMKKTVRIRVQENNVIAGDELHILTEVYDNAFRPVEGAKVSLTVRSGNKEHKQMMKPLGRGKYLAEYSAGDQGAMRLVADAVLNDQALGRDTTTVFIAPNNPELQDLRAHPKLMAEIANASGGISGPPDSLVSLLRQIRINSVVREDVKVWQLYRSLYVLGVVLLLLFSEWFIRKRLGML